MSSIDELVERFRNLDDVQRQKMLYVAVGIIVLVYLMIQLDRSFNVMGSLLGSGAEYANQSVQGLQNAGKTL